MALGISNNSMINSLIEYKAGKKNSDKANLAETEKNAENTNVNPFAKGNEDIDKEENDRLLFKSQMSGTKLEALGEYLGALQTAQRECGNDGITMYRRINRMMETEKEYKTTDDYKNKKDSNTFISDQIDVMKEKQEEIKARKEKKEKEKENIEKSDNKKISNSLEHLENNIEESKNSKFEATIQQRRVAEMYKRDDDTNKQIIQNEGTESVDLSL